MPKSFLVEPENLPHVVKGWLKAANLGDVAEVEDSVEEGHGRKAREAGGRRGRETHPLR